MSFIPQVSLSDAAVQYETTAEQFIQANQSLKTQLAAARQLIANLVQTNSAYEDRLRELRDQIPIQQNELFAARQLIDHLAHTSPSDYSAFSDKIAELSLQLQHHTVPMANPQTVAELFEYSVHMAAN